MLYVLFFKALGLCSYAVFGILSVLVGSSIHFPRDEMFASTVIFKFAPDGKNLRKVEFM
jgi:hypothetical protein